MNQLSSFISLSSFFLSSPPASPNLFSFQEMVEYFGVKPKSNEKEVAPSVIFMLWFEFCNDFKIVWKRELKSVSKERWGRLSKDTMVRWCELKENKNVSYSMRYTICFIYTIRFVWLVVFQTDGGARISENYHRGEESRDQENQPQQSGRLEPVSFFDCQCVLFWNAQ